MNRASAKTTSASGARKRAGLRPAIAIDDTPGFGRSRRAAGSPDRSRVALSRAPRPPRGAARPRRARPPPAPPPAVSCAFAIERDALTSPAARPGSNAGASSAIEPPCAPIPGSRNGAWGISSRMRARCCGRRRAGDRSDLGQPGLRTRRARRGDQAGDLLPQRPAGGQLGVEEIGGARVGGAHEHEDAGARPRRAPSTNGASASPPSSGFCVTASAPRPALSPNGRGDPAEHGLLVCAGAAGEVAALGVGDHQQAVLACMGGRGLEREPACEAEPLEAGQLRLDRDAGRRRPRRSARGSARAPRRPPRAGPRGRPRRGRARPSARRRPAPRTSRARDSAMPSTAAGHSFAGSGSIPSTSWDSRAATAAARRSPNGIAGDASPSTDKASPGAAT